MVQRFRWSPRFSAVIFPWLLLALPLPQEPLHGQTKTHWVIPTTIGYGGVGFAAAYLALSEAAREAERQGDPDYSWGAIPLAALASYLVGGRLGYRLGAEVDSLLAEGIPPSPRQRRGVQLGAVLAGATVGALVSLFPRSVSDGSDARITATWALSGAAVGAILLVVGNKHLNPGNVGIESHFEVAPTGGLGFGFAYRF